MTKEMAFIKKCPSEANKTCSKLQKIISFFGQIKPKIVKNVAFSNLIKSFWSKIIPTANPAVLEAECQLWSPQW